MLVISGSLIGCKTTTTTETTAAETTAAATETTAAATTAAATTASPVLGIPLKWFTMTAMSPTTESIKGWEDIGGGKVTIEEQGYEGYRDKLLIEWAAGGQSYDVVGVSDEWIADFVEPGYLFALDDFIAATDSTYDFNDFIKAPIELVSQYPQSTGKKYTIPYLTFSLVLAYNTKMFKEAGIVDENGNAKPPKTMAEFIEDLKLLTKPEKNQYGFAPLFLKGETVTIQYEHWHRVFTGLGGVLDANNKPQVGTPESIAALEFMSEILKYSPPGALNFRDFEVTTSIKTGQAAMEFIWGAFGADLLNEKDNPEAKNIAFAPTPESPITGTPMPMGAAWGFGIPANAKDPAASWEFVKFMSTKEIQTQELDKGTGTFGAGPTRTSVFDSDIAKSKPWMVTQGQVLPFTGYRPHLPQWTEISVIISDEVSAALAGQKSAADAMAAAQQKIETLMAK